MSKHYVKILDIEKITHNVLKFTTEKPEGYKFTPGQATDVAINKKGFEDEKRPFTFTSLNDWQNLEFTIKIYPDHDGVTKELSKLNKGDELIIHDVWGAIEYKGPGTFIAGGVGVTPFISIFRYLNSVNKTENNKLIFANKTEADIINKDEFEKILGDSFINILEKENKEEYYQGLIDEDFLKEHLISDQIVYLCGPPEMMEAVEKHLKNLNVSDNNIIKEEF